ncbi:zf-C2H2 domain-containing protein [Rhizoctonia solani AG-1 IA]|uniref:Zf-C2H2 domain-containing protein n=1 Tax=Thanatephorus cucumeris (strain AG1-IA) TaxID=983506 RepID=L8WZ18_THACA|nr:zf-C2H2 domain-containing protein [Rhizoctonia solani AG-1 IA]
MSSATPLDLLCFAALQPHDELVYRQSAPHVLPPVTNDMPASRTLPSLVALASMNYATPNEQPLPPLLGSPMQVRPSGGRAERYKKYECTGCDKRFERPSQLRTVRSVDRPPPMGSDQPICLFVCLFVLI